MRIIGITGGIACGKSTAADIFRRLGAFVIDADEIAREVVRPGTPGFEQVVAHFGPGILTPSGEIDREALGEIVFRDPAERKVLEGITHPLIVARIAARLQEALAAGAEIAMIEAALMIEGGRSRDLVEKIIVVSAPEELQVQRLAQRNGYTREAALQRISAQMPLEEKIRQADFVIDNRADLDALERACRAIWEELRQEEVSL